MSTIGEERMKALDSVKTLNAIINMKRNNFLFTKKESNLKKSCVFKDFELLNSNLWDINCVFKIESYLGFLAAVLTELQVVLIINSLHSGEVLPSIYMSN